MERNLRSMIDLKPNIVYMETMRTIVIGDVHGCLEECQALIEKVRYLPGIDHLLFLGDLLDKGPDPLGVLRYVRKLPGAHCLRGNHEDKALRWIRNEKRKQANPSFRNAMEVSPATRDQWASLTEEEVHWLRNLPVVLNLKNGFLAVHGGFLPGVPLNEQETEKIIRVRWVDANGKYVHLPEGSRKKPAGVFDWMEVWDGAAHVVYGHAVHSLTTPRIDQPRAHICVGLDTGCVHGGHLTAMVFEGPFPGDFHFEQIRAKKEYMALPPETREVLMGSSLSGG